MQRVICTRPNASNLINGVVFEPHENGVISVEISEEQAQNFLRVPGYYLADVAAKDKKPEQPKAPVDPVETEKPLAPDADGDGDVDGDDLDLLRQQAEELGIKVDKRWKHERLIAEISKAEAAAEAAASAEADGDGDNDQF